MKIATKETTLMDGSKVHDVNLFPNGGSPMNRKVIISCHSKSAADKFMVQFKNLLEEHTIECLEDIDGNWL